MKITDKRQLETLTEKEMQQPIDVVGIVGLGIELLTKLITALSNVSFGKWKIQRNINAENARLIAELRAEVDALKRDREL